jgi:hypothetical protein
MKGTLLPNFNKILGREFLIVGVQQAEGIFSILYTNLNPWLKILCLGANDVSAERRYGETT